MRFANGMSGFGTGTCMIPGLRGYEWDFDDLPVYREPPVMRAAQAIAAPAMNDPNRPQNNLPNQLTAPQRVRIFESPLAEALNCELLKDLPTNRFFTNVFRASSPENAIEKGSVQPSQMTAAIMKATAADIPFYILGFTIGDPRAVSATHGFLAIIPKDDGGMVISSSHPSIFGIPCKPKDHPYKCSRLLTTPAEITAFLATITSIRTSGLPFDQPNVASGEQTVRLYKELNQAGTAGLDRNGVVGCDRWFESLQDQKMLSPVMGLGLAKVKSLRNLLFYAAENKQTMSDYEFFVDCLLQSVDGQSLAVTGAFTKIGFHLTVYDVGRLVAIAAKASEGSLSPNPKELKAACDGFQAELRQRLGQQAKETINRFFRAMILLAADRNEQRPMTLSQVLLTYLAFRCPGRQQLPEYLLGLKDGGIALGALAQSILIDPVARKAWQDNPPAATIEAFDVNASKSYAPQVLIDTLSSKNKFRFLNYQRVYTTHNGRTVDYLDCGESTTLNLISRLIYDGFRLQPEKLKLWGFAPHPKMVAFFADHDFDDYESTAYRVAWAQMIQEVAKDYGTMIDSFFKDNKGYEFSPTWLNVALLLDLLLNQGANTQQDGKITITKPIDTLKRIFAQIPGLMVSATELESLDPVESGKLNLKLADSEQLLVNIMSRTHATMTSTGSPQNQTVSLDPQALLANFEPDYSPIIMSLSDFGASLKGERFDQLSLQDKERLLMALNFDQLALSNLRELVAINSPFSKRVALKLWQKESLIPNNPRLQDVRDAIKGGSKDTWEWIEHSSSGS